MSRIIPVSAALFSALRHERARLHVEGESLEPREPVELHGKVEVDA
ncbi:MAG TPA: hypothetical protein VFU73_15665 [Actinocrinis sp.]|nr:hypothetical protein [Actinocrinis sp.]